MIDVQAHVGEQQARVVCVVQARQGSARLPGKSLRPLAGRSLISHVLERARAVVGVGEVVLATTAHPVDAPLAAEGARLGVRVFRGPEADVLARFVLVADVTGAETLMRVTGDCPLLCPDVAALVLRLYRRSLIPVSYAWNDTARSGYPDGTDVEVFSAAALRMADHAVRFAGGDREHVTPWMRRHLTAAVLRHDVDLSRLKLSVDTADDFARVARILAAGPVDHTLPSTLDAARRAGEDV